MRFSDLVCAALVGILVFIMVIISLFVFTSLAIGVMHLGTPNIRVGDTQNVHDSTVVREFVEKWERLHDLVGHITAYQVEQAMAEISRFAPDAAKVLAEAERGEILSSIDQREDVLLGFVWIRIHQPANDARRAELLDMFRESLKDCMQDDVPVCITGRSTRFMDALVMNDADEILAAPLQNTDAIKAEIRWNMKQFVDQTMEFLRREYPDFYRRYESGESAPDIERYNAQLRDEMMNMLRVYEGRLTPMEFAGVRTEVEALI